MEEKKVSELQNVSKEWISATGKAFRHIDKELGVKGRIAVIFGIVVIWLLGALVAHTEDRHERSFDRDGRGSMMQDRRGFGNTQEDMFTQMRNAMDRDFDTMGGKKQGLQGCSNQANLEVNGKKISAQDMSSHENCPFANQMNPQANSQSDSMFDRMESRMKQIFGSDEVPVKQAIIPSTGTGN